MSVSYDQIKEHFKKVRHYISNDLRLLIGNKAGGNYLAAFLIACACETLAWYRYGNNKGHDILAEMLLPPRWRPVAWSIFDCMRNGIAHRYETKTLIIGSKRLDLGISWRMKRHLYYSAKQSTLFLNIQDMSRKLLSALARYEKELKCDPALRDRFYQSMIGKWEKEPPANELPTWKVLLKL